MQQSRNTCHNIYIYIDLISHHAVYAGNSIETDLNAGVCSDIYTLLYLYHIPNLRFFNYLPCY